jgi:glycosyltransferase involved in cell wall biosynthesis
VKIESRALAKIDAVICPSNYMKDMFISTFGNKIPVSVLPNLIDNKFIESIEAVSVNKKIDLDPGFPVVYIPSGGSSVKGERFVIEIIRRLAVRYNYKIGFYISGGLSSVQTEELEILGRYSKLVFSPGVVDNIANIGLIKSCKICVSPTMIESFGMANLEANFCNVPVVTFDVGGNKELIEDGQNGFVVPILDIEAMLLKTCDILDGKITMDPQAFVKSKFSVKALEGKYNEFLTTIG